MLDMAERYEKLRWRLQVLSEVHYGMYGAGSTQAVHVVFRNCYTVVDTPQIRIFK